MTPLPIMFSYSQLALNVLIELNFARFRVSVICIIMYRLKINAVNPE